MLSGGDGTDTLSMSTANAVTLSGAVQTFYTGFEQLLINDNGTGIVDLASVGFTNNVTTSGSTGLLTLNNLANNGTVVLTKAVTTGVTVVMKDAATGLTDVLNVRVDNINGTGNVAAGTLTAANVETVNITVADGDNTGPDTHSLTLVADKATSVVIVNADAGDKTKFTLDVTGSTKVSSIDGSAMEGALTVTSLNMTDKTTIKGGSGDDVFKTSHSEDVLIGGAGSDTLEAADGANLVSLQGGAGKDTYKIGVVSNSSGYATISGTAAELSGDVIQFGVVTVKDFAAAKIVLGATAVFQDYANEAVKGTTADNFASWFQFAGDTYVVQNNNVAATFINGSDAIVKITGLVDFTYNLTGGIGILEIA